MRAAPYEEGPRCPCKASGPSSQTKTRTLRGVRLTSLRRKEITWQFQKRHPKQKHRRYVPTAEWKWSLSVSNQFCLVGNSRISLSHARSAVLRKSSGSSAFVIRNLPEEMVLDRRPVLHQPASSNRGACSAHHQDHLRIRLRAFPQAVIYVMRDVFGRLDHFRRDRTIRLWRGGGTHDGAGLSDHGPLPDLYGTEGMADRRHPTIAFLSGGYESRWQDLGKEYGPFAGHAARPGARAVREPRDFRQPGRRPADRHLRRSAE